MICPIDNKECGWRCQSPCDERSGNLTPKRYAPIVPGPAPDDGTGRRSAYDTTWPDVHSKGSS